MCEHAAGEAFYLCPTSSRLNRTPPIGAPKATDTPAAAAADKTFRIQTFLADQHVKCPLAGLKSHYNGYNSHLQYILSILEMTKG